MENPHEIPQISFSCGIVLCAVMSCHVTSSHSVIIKHCLHRKLEKLRTEKRSIITGSDKWRDVADFRGCWAGRRDSVCNEDEDEEAEHMADDTRHMKVWDDTTTHLPSAAEMGNRLREVCAVYCAVSNPILADDDLGGQWANSVAST